MTRESVILNVCGGLECRSECLTNMQEALGSIPSKEKKREKKGGKGRKERKEKLESSTLLSNNTQVTPNTTCSDSGGEVGTKERYRRWEEEKEECTLHLRYQ